ncbi:hypothetical protein [Streptomyces sp. AK02-04a]|uniref:hypothetical protein n=1 Tax=Streptomyces sp. AK02-04a TaxID=3028649 RepID=UPI0029B934A3|nr:hypothetical protein [Streptomyces sp. AK02-04a]MDX3761569.1 hypothetical protein [Streptomyces sp. AK02-04a]
MAGFEVIITTAVENAATPDQTFDEHERPQRESIDFLLRGQRTSPFGRWPPHVDPVTVSRSRSPEQHFFQVLIPTLKFSSEVPERAEAHKVAGDDRLDDHHTTVIKPDYPDHHVAVHEEAEPVVQPEVVDVVPVTKPGAWPDVAEPEPVVLAVADPPPVVGSRSRSGLRHGAGGGWSRAGLRHGAGGGWSRAGLRICHSGHRPREGDPGCQEGDDRGC